MVKRKWLFFGAGAIGTYIGGSLLLRQAADSVVFLERPAVAEELRRRGLRLNLGGQEHALPAQAAGSLAEALQQDSFDVAVFALKSFDTGPALAGLGADLTRLPPALCLSNGVDNEPQMTKLLGQGRVLAGTVTSAVGRRAAGDIVLERLRGMGVAAGHPLSEDIAAAFNLAGLNARLYPNADAMKWSKMLTNLLANATSAILDLTPAEIFAHPGLCRLEVLQLREALAVMARLGLPVVDLPGTPVRLLAFGMKYAPLALARPLLQRGVGKGRGNKMPSFHIDLHGGRGQSEVDYLNGAVARVGKQLGLSTPVNQTLTEVLLALTNGSLPLESFRRQPEKLLARIAQAGG